MAIILTKDQYVFIEKHGEETFPHECCGFILGDVDNGTKIVRELIRASNTREEEARGNRFLIDPREFLEAEKQARQQGLDVVGIYHSHPNEAAVPSRYDQDHAWPWYSYIIVSVMERKADHMHSWVLEDDRSAFHEEEVTIAS